MAEIIDAIPVMFSVYGNKRGPWSLGYVHPKYKDTIKTYQVKPYIGGDYPEIPVYDQFNGIPVYPKVIVLFDDFRAPTWKPDWNWAAQCK